MKLRLGFHYHVPVFLDEAGTIRTRGEQGRFLDALASECDELVCFLHSAPIGTHEQMHYTLQASNVQCVNIGPHTSVPRRMLRAFVTKTQVKEWENRLDAFLVRGPSPLLPTVATATRLPLVLLLVGDYLA